MRIALVHDYFREYGGAERVVEALHNMFPSAPVYTAFVDKWALGIQWKRFADWDIRESWAARIPFIKKLYSPLRVLSANFFESFDFSRYDLVISSTNMYMAKAVRTRPPTKHLCYCHTPPRSLYGYTTMMDWKKNPLVRFGGEFINHFMRLVDFRTAQNPDLFIANSKEVQKRIAKFYRRTSVVVYPPIDIPPTLPAAKKQDMVLFVGRLGVSKHVDLVIRACNTMKKKLYVIGVGRDEKYLRSLAGPTIEFLGSVSDDTLHRLYAEARVLVYPAEDEDFGMIPVESMAYGTPVIVHRSGGFLESVVENKTGLFIDELSAGAIVEAMRKAEKMQWDRKKIHEHAKTFSKERFQKEIARVISSVTAA